MPDDAGASTATDSASTDAQPQGQHATSDRQDDGRKDGKGAHSPAPGDDRSAEELLADAVNSDGDGDEGASGDDALKAAQAELAKWKAQARKNEQRARENAEKAKNFDAYQQSQMTAAERQAAELAAAREEARTEREERLRLLAAASYDLPPSMLPHLGGGTEDEINARAEALAAAINERAAVMAAAQAQAQATGQPQQPRNGAGGYRPVESLRPGALPASDNKPVNPNNWLRAAVAAKKS